MDGDGRREVVFASWDGNLYVLDCGGRVVRSFHTTGGVVSSPAVGDLDGDGFLDVVFGSNDKAVHAVLYRGPVVSFRRDSNFVSSPTVVGGEVVACSEDGWVYMLSVSHGFEVGRNADFYRMGVRWNVSVGGGIVSSAGVGVLGNGSGIVIFVGSDDRNMYVFSVDGRRIKAYSTSGRIVSQPVLVDFDGDGFLEVLFSTVDGELFVLDSGFSAVWSRGLGERVVSSPVVADLEGDGFLEVVVASERGSVYVFGAETTTTTTLTTTTSSTSTTTSTTTPSLVSTTSLVGVASSPTAVLEVLGSTTTVVALRGGAPVGRVVGIPSEGVAVSLFLLFLSAHFLHYKKRYGY